MSFTKPNWSVEQRKAWWALPTETRKNYWSSTGLEPTDTGMSDPYMEQPALPYEHFQTWQTKQATETPQKNKLQAQVSDEKAMAGRPGPQHPGGDP